MSMSVAEKYCLRVQAAKDAREEKHELRRKKRIAIEERLRKIREQRRKLRTQANKNPISSRALTTPDQDFSKSPTQSDNDSDDNGDRLNSNSNDDQSNQSNESAPFSDPVEKVANSTEERRLPMVIRLMERIRQHREKQKTLKTMSSSLRNSDLDIPGPIGASENVDISKLSSGSNSKPDEINENISGSNPMEIEEVEQNIPEPGSSLISDMEVKRLKENSSKYVHVMGSTNDNERCQNFKLRKKSPTAEAKMTMNSSSSNDKYNENQPKGNSDVEQTYEDSSDTMSFVSGDMAVERPEEYSSKTECLSKAGVENRQDYQLRNVRSSTLSSTDSEEKCFEQNSPQNELVDLTKDKICSKKVATEAQKHKEPVKKAMTALNRCIYYTKPGQQSEPVSVDGDSTPVEPQNKEEPVQKAMTVLNHCIVYTKPGQKLDSVAQRNPSSLQNPYPSVCKDISESSMSSENVDHLKSNSDRDHTIPLVLCGSTSSGRESICPDHESELVDKPTKKRTRIQNSWVVYTKEDQKPKPTAKLKPTSSLGPVLDMDSVISGPSVQAFLNDTIYSKSSKVSISIVDQAVDEKRKRPEHVSSESDKKPEKNKGEKIRDFFLRIKEKVKQKQQNGELTMNQDPSSSKNLMISDSEMCEAISESQIESLNVTNKLDPSKSSKNSKSIADQIKVPLSASNSSTVDDGKDQKPLFQNSPQADGWRPIPNAKKYGERYKKRMAFLAAMTPDLPIAEQCKERYKKRMKEPQKQRANCSTTNTNVKLQDLFSRINPTKYTETMEKDKILNSKPLTCSDSIVSNNSTGDQNNKSFSETPPATFRCFEKQSPNSEQVPNANNKPNNWKKPMQLPTTEQCRERYKKRMKEPPKQTNILNHSKFPKADILRRNTNVKLQDLFSRINDTKSTNDAESSIISLDSPSPPSSPLQTSDENTGVSSTTTSSSSSGPLTVNSSESAGSGMLLNPLALNNKNKRLKLHRNQK